MNDFQILVFPQMARDILKSIENDVQNLFPIAHIQADE